MMVVVVARVGVPMCGDGGSPKDTDQAPKPYSDKYEHTDDYMTAMDLKAEVEVGIGIVSQHIRECKCGKAFESGPT